MAKNNLSTIERKTLLDNYGRWLWVMRTIPEHATHWLTGIVLPPHERYLVRYVFSDYTEKAVVASRGTSKSFVVGSLCPPLISLLHANRNAVVVSASGFRGGKLLFADTERLFRGHLSAQKLPDEFMLAALEEGKGDKVIRREPDKWVIPLGSHSTVTTVPTNDPVKLRGIRGHVVIIDERNTFDGEVVQTVIRPWMNVGANFARPALGAGNNQIIQISTIDYTTRDWHPELENMKKLAQREYEAAKARKAGDWRTFDNLYAMEEGALKSASFAYARFDYTDLLIPETIEDEYGDVYRIDYPFGKGKVEDYLLWDEVDQCNYWYTYPVEKRQLEEPKRNGTMDEELWAAEQRNVFIQTAGTVFPHSLLKTISERPIYKGKDEDDDLDYFAPVMFTCGDPCVLGVDYARESDEAAFVVIRLGPLAEGKFDRNPFKDKEGRECLGKTPWSNVIWAESAKRMTANECAAKIVQFCARYNIIHRLLPDGTYVRGIGLDRMNSGVGVRDELAQPKPSSLKDGNIDTNWEVPAKIFDPEDEDYMHYTVLMENSKDYRPILECIMPNNQSNHDMVMGQRALMQTKNIWIAKHRAPSDWAKEMGFATPTGQADVNNPEYQNIRVGFNGIQRLLKQLVKVQRTIMPSGKTKYEMPGNTRLDEGKKDLFSAFLYAGHMARQHLVAATEEDVTPPDAKPLIVTLKGGLSRLSSAGDYRRTRIR